MTVDGSTQRHQLSHLELMGHLFRRAGFGATRDELEAALANGYESTLEELLHVDDAGRLYVAEHSRHRIRVYERS